MIWTICMLLLVVAWLAFTLTAFCPLRAYRQKLSEAQLQQEEKNE